MDWGSVAFIVIANAVTSGLLMAGGLWFLRERLMPGAEHTQVRAPQAVADSELAAEQPAASRRQRRRRRAPGRTVAVAEPEARSASPRRGLKDFLAPVGGAPGTITDEQRIGIKDLLGKAAPTLWMSSAQAHAVLCARDYAEAVIDHRQGSRADFDGRHKIVRRLAFAILADDRARDFVVDWAEGRYIDDDSTAPDPLEQDVWAWVQHHAARLMEAEGRYVEAA